MCPTLILSFRRSLNFGHFSCFHINSENNLLFTPIIICNVNLVFPNRIFLFQNCYINTRISFGICQRWNWCFPKNFSSSVIFSKSAITMISSQADSYAISVRSRQKNIFFSNLIGWFFFNSTISSPSGDKTIYRLLLLLPFKGDSTTTLSLNQ